MWVIVSPAGPGASIRSAFSTSRRSVWLAVRCNAGPQHRPKPRLDAVRGVIGGEPRGRYRR